VEFAASYELASVARAFTEYLGSETQSHDDWYSDRGLISNSPGDYTASVAPVGAYATLAYWRTLLPSLLNGLRTTDILWREQMNGK